MAVHALSNHSPPMFNKEYNLWLNINAYKLVIPQMGRACLMLGDAFYI